MTNNVRRQHRLTHRQFAHSCTYWLQIGKIPGSKELQPLRRGMSIQDDHSRPAIALGQNKHSPHLSLRGLAPGQWRELQPLERQQIEKLLKN